MIKRKSENKTLVKIIKSSLKEMKKENEILEEVRNEVKNLILLNDHYNIYQFNHITKNYRREFTRGELSDIVNDSIIKFNRDIDDHIDKAIDWYIATTYGSDLSVLGGDHNHIGSITDMTADSRDDALKADLNKAVEKKLDRIKRVQDILKASVKNG